MSRSINATLQTFVGLTLRISGAASGIDVLCDTRFAASVECGC